MLQSKARLLELNAKLAETLTSKGVTATADETTTALVNKVADIASGDDSILRGLLQGDLTEIVMPYGITSIRNYAFSNYTNLTSISIPNSVKSIGEYAFTTCRKIKDITIPDSVKSIGHHAFYSNDSLISINIPLNLTTISTSMLHYCISLASITIPDSVTSISNMAFYNCKNLKTITIPNSIKTIGNVIFGNCNNLEFITLGDGFNADKLDLSESILYTRETIISWLNALADRTGQTAYKLTIGATNLAKLTEEDILIATNKNWTLA